jgi:hypothetical protein
MSDSKRSDHWDLLASVLGAEPIKKEPEAPAPQVEEQISEVAEKPEVQASIPQPHSEPPVARPSRSLSNWDALAMDLGIEVKPEPLPPPAPIQTPAPRHVEKKAVIQREQPHEPSRPAVVESSRQSDRFETSETLPAEESDEPGEKKSRHRRRRRRKGKDKDHPNTEMKKPSPELGLETPTDSDLIDISLEIADQVDTEIEQGSEEGNADTQPQKHRRSRRGSRKRKKKGTETARENSTDVKKDSFNRRAESVASTELSDDSGGEEEILDEEHEEGAQRGAKSGFRAIPTWEEAVGCIVSKNMESRPRRQGNGPPRSRSGGDSHKRRRK